MSVGFARLPEILLALHDGFSSSLRRHTPTNITKQGTRSTQTTNSVLVIYDYVVA